MFGCTSLVEFHNAIDRFSVKRYYNDFFLPIRQSSVIIKDVNVSLHGSEGSNASIRCPIAAPMKFFSTL